MRRYVRRYQRRWEELCTADSGSSIPEAVTEDMEGVRWAHDLSWYVLDGLYCPLPTVTSGMFYGPLLIFSGRCGAFSSVPRLWNKKALEWGKSEV